MRSWTASGAVAVLLLIGACGNETAGGEHEGHTTQEPTMSQSPTPTPAGTPVDQAKADLSKRLGKDPAEITVVSAEEVTWRDGSIGCPEPGKMYTQALTPGERIVLQADGKRYEYHAGTGRAPFLCEKPQPPLKR